MLSGAGDPINTADLSEKARKNFQRDFVLAGLTERLDESVLLCRKLLGRRRVC